MEKETYKFLPVKEPTHRELNILKAELGMTFDELMLSLIKLYRSSLTRN